MNIGLCHMSLNVSQANVVVTLKVHDALSTFRNTLVALLI